jgi:histidine triad (HIT) family protein
MKRACVFCKIRDGKLPADIVRETDELLVIKDIIPKAPTHFLIIPKKHIKDMFSLNHETAHLPLQIIRMARSLARKLPKPPYFRLVFNTGAGAGQTVFHLHGHFMSGKKMTEL